MNFAIIGAGAMGSIIGATLQEGGARVIMVDPYAEHIRTLCQKGLTLESKDETESVPLQGVLSVADISQPMDAVIILTKGYTTKDVAKEILPLVTPSTLLITLQNGLGNTEILSEAYPKNTVLCGVMEMGGILLGPGHVRALIDPNSQILLGSTHRSITPEMQALAEFFHKGGIPCNLVENPDDALWKKLLSNCIGNAASAVTRLQLGPYFQSTCSKEIGMALEQEIRAIAEAKHITLPERRAHTGGRIKPGAPMYSHLSSTLQDVVRHNPTEIDNLNGAVVREGKKLGIPTPYNEMLVWLVKVIEENYEKQV